MPVTTRISLITRIGDSNDSASWAEFVRLYGPFIYAMGRRSGLQDADACDLVQDVMREVSRSVAGFEASPQAGRFRAWVGVIARRTLARFFEKNKTRINGAGDTANIAVLSSIPACDDVDAWEHEHEQYFFRWAAERVRDEFTATTWQAFWLTAVDGVAASKAAARLGISVGAVYIAKSRVTSRLREKAMKASSLALYE